MEELMSMQDLISKLKMRNENDEKFKKISQFKPIDLLERIINFYSKSEELIIMVDELEISEENKILIKNKISEMKELFN